MTEYPKEFEQLENNQKELNIEELLSEANINSILDYKDISDRNTMKAFATDRARDLRSVKLFNDTYKFHEDKRSPKNTVGQSPGYTKFTDLKKNYRCGDYIATDSGVSILKNKNSDFPEMIIVCPHPIYIECFYENIDTAQMQEKVKLKFKKNNRWRSLVVDKSTISDRSKIVTLSNSGIEVNTNTASDLIDYFATLSAQNMTGNTKIPYRKSTTKMGWTHEATFVPYDTSITFDGEESFADIHDSISTKGDFKKWKKETIKNIEYNPVNQLILATSFAAPLVSLVGANPFIMHLWGGTGTGKTVALMMASSIWGDPEIGRYTRSLNSTTVGFEYTAGFLNHLPLICDELQLIVQNRQYEQNFDSLIMNLCSGIGKTRGTQDGGVREQERWRNCFLFSGEQPIIQTVSGGGGAVNRVIEIKTTQSLFDDGNWSSNFYRGNYGEAGKRFIEVIISKLKEDENYLLDMFKVMNKELNKHDGDKQAPAMALI